MYIVGEFTRHHSDMFDDSNPLEFVKYVEELTREDLLKTKGDDGFQVINILTKEYYDPKQNKWIKLKTTI